MEQKSSVKKNAPWRWVWNETPGKETHTPPPQATSSAAMGDNTKQGPRQETQIKRPQEKGKNKGENPFMTLGRIHQNPLNSSKPTQNSQKGSADMASGTVGLAVVADDVQQRPIAKPRTSLLAREQNKNTKVTPFVTVISEMVGETKTNHGNSKPQQPPLTPRKTIYNSLQGTNLAAQQKESPDINKNILPNQLATRNTQADSQDIRVRTKQSQPQQPGPAAVVNSATRDTNQKTAQQSPEKNINDGKVQRNPKDRNNSTGNSGPGEANTQVSPKSALTATLNKALQKRSPPKNNSRAKVDPFFERHHVLTTKIGKHVDMEEQLGIFIRDTTMNPNEVQRRHQFLDELLGLIRPLYPDSILYPFGSFVTNLGDTDSDVDIFVDAHGTTMANGYTRLPHPQEDKVYVFDTIFRGLRRSHRYFKQVIQIPQARIPIIKLVHLTTNVNADLSFENLMSVQNSLLIAFYVNFEPRVRPLLLIIRYWARFHSLSGCNLVKNYGLVLMALTFLMRKKLIPTVHVLQVLAHGPLLIENWNAAFCQNIESVKHSPAFWNQRQPMKEFSGPPNIREVLQLAQEFFDTFANLDYANDVICSLTGDFLPRESFIAENEERLPEELGRYKSWAQTRERDQRLDIKSALCVQDPFNLGFNVGGCTREQIIIKFKGACVLASTQLTKILAADRPNLTDIFTPLPPDFSKLTKKEKFKAKLESQAAIAAARKTGTKDKEKDTSNKNVPESASVPTPTPTSLVPSNYNRESVTLKLRPSHDYHIQCHVLTKKLITSFTPPDFLDNLFYSLWLKFMYDFLKTALQQAYRLEVRLDDCKCKEYFRDKRAQEKNKTQSESSTAKTQDNEDVVSDPINERTSVADAKDVEMSPNYPSSDPIWGDRSSQVVETVQSLLIPGKESPIDTTTISPINGQPFMTPRGHGGGSQSTTPELTETIWRTSRGRGRGRGRNPKRQFPSPEAEIPGLRTPESESTHKLLKPSAVTPPLVRDVKEVEVEFDFESTDSENETKVDSKSNTTENTKVDSKSETPESTKMDTKSEESPAAESKTTDGRDDDPEIDDGDEDKHKHLDEFKLHCTGTFQVWEGRKKNRKVAIRSGTTNPIEVEANVTQLLLDQMYAGLVPKTPIFKFDMDVHVGDEAGIEDPVFLIRLTEEFLPGGLKLNRQALGYFSGNVLRSLSSTYVKYRLDKWFLTEGGKEMIIDAGERPWTLN